MNALEIFYLLGSYFGDGHIYYAKHEIGSSYQFSIVSEDEDFCKICSNIVYNHHNKYGTIKLINNYYKLVVCSRYLCDSILDQTCSVADYCSANRYQKKSRLPIFPNMECKKYFVQGLMDSDGWISKRKNGKYIKYEVGFKNTSILSPLIYKLMLELGLSCSKLSFRNGKKHKAYWFWTITPRNYISTIGFSIMRKKKLCQEFLKDRKNKNLEFQIVKKNERII